MSSSSESHGTHDLNVPTATAPQGELVERLRTEADYLDANLKTFTGPLSTITALRGAAAEIERLTRELDEWTAWGEDLSPAELSNGMDNLKRRAETAEADLARAREALTDIAAATDADDPESYRSDDREGCLDTVHAIARAALPNTTGEAE